MTKLGAALTLAALFAACGAPQPLPGPNDQLPPGAVVIYSNMGGQEPVRVIQVNGCYMTEVLEGGQWLLNNKAFIGADPDVSCGEGAAPNVP